MRRHRHPSDDNLDCLRLLGWSNGPASGRGSQTAQRCAKAPGHRGGVPFQGPARSAWSGAARSLYGQPGFLFVRGVYETIQAALDACGMPSVLNEGVRVILLDQIAETSHDKP